MPVAYLDCPGGQRIACLLASTDRERRRGLAGQSRVPLDGMLFDFSPARVQLITMDETRIPLGIAWIDAQGVIRRSVARAEPFRQKPYGCSFPARWILETSPEKLATLGFAVGKRVQVWLPRDRPHQLG